MPKIDFIKFLVAISLIAAFNFTIYALAYVEIPEGTRSHKGGQVLVKLKDTPTKKNNYIPFGEFQKGMI